MPIKNQQDILAKLNIEQLNPMQEATAAALSTADHLVLLSPTGTGKTIAFLLPILESLDPESTEIQALILVPSRELAIQIETVLREMGTGYKVNSVYGGIPATKDKMALKHRPAILIGTPGRVSDHIHYENFSTESIRTLVLDEFDKSLEIGFEEQMRDILQALPHVKRRILTSATQGVKIPFFVGLRNHATINHLDQASSQLAIKRILSPEKDKLDTLVAALRHIGNQPGIVFCNYKDTIQRVSGHLERQGIANGCFYGGMEQIDRERALVKFRNGTHRLIIATDLAARGLDIPELGFILHYQLPHRGEEFTHRNGRTARMHAQGTAYVLQWEKEPLPDFIPEAEVEELETADTPAPSPWRTLYISGGRKDKISKGDIAGAFMKQAQLTKEELGVIELKQDCAFVAVQASKVKEAVAGVNNTRLKKKKVRVAEV
ncbi:MAG: DEAD/DEAH box helicase [Bacteroidota bacterium]